MATRPSSGVRRNARTGYPAAAAAVGVGLDEALAGFGIPPAAVLSKVAHAWEQAVGQTGQRCRLEGISGKALHVVAADAATASEIKWDARRIVCAVNESAGESVAETIRVRVSDVCASTVATSRT